MCKGIRLLLYIKDIVHKMRRRSGIILILLSCFLGCSLAACGIGTGNSGQNTTVHQQSVQTDSGTPVTYSTQAHDVVVRIFHGGGKVGTLEITPDVSIYGDGTFITGPGLQLQQGSIDSGKLQDLLHTITSTDHLLQLHQQVFDDIPDQNVTLLQINLNGKNYQFTYGPFGNLLESTQAIQEYQRLGNAISTINNALTGPVNTYISQDQALLVYNTY